MGQDPYGDYTNIKAWAKFVGIPGVVLSVIFLISGAPDLSLAILVVTAIAVGGYALFVLAVADTTNVLYAKQRKDVN